MVPSGYLTKLYPSRPELDAPKIVRCSNVGMPKRRGNPLWTQGRENDVHVPPLKSEFERVAACLKLSPEQYASSLKPRAWAEKNWWQKFVPEKLLRTWHLREWGLT
jgi:hypothetical protein